MPSDFQFKDPPPPQPSEFQKAIHGMVWIFSGNEKCDERECDVQCICHNGPQVLKIEPAPVIRPAR